jgi:hypothetical protein
MFQSFLAQVVKAHDLFVESQDDTSLLQGDRMPSTMYCAGLNGKCYTFRILHWLGMKGQSHNSRSHVLLVCHLALNLKVDDADMDSMNNSLERQQTRRFAVALIYLRVATKGPELESQELLDAITSLVIMEPALEYLHGSSWIQLTWLYIVS